MKKIKFLISFLIISIIGILKIDNAYALDYVRYVNQNYDNISPTLLQKLETYKDYVFNQLYENNYPVYYLIYYYKNSNTNKEYISMYLTNNDYDLVNSSIAPTGFLYRADNSGSTHKHYKNRFSLFGLDTSKFCLLEGNAFIWNLTEYQNIHLGDLNYALDLLNNNSSCTRSNKLADVYNFVSSDAYSSSSTMPINYEDIFFIYDSNLPIYYTGSRLSYNTGFSSISDINTICSSYVNNLADSGNDLNFNIRFNDNLAGLSVDMYCGYEVPTYLEQANYEGELRFSSTGLTRSLSSFDIYFQETEQSSATLKYTSTSPVYVDSFKFYGMTCNPTAYQGTCYWEEIPYNSNLVSITNDNLLNTSTGYEYKFDYNVILDDYNKIKIAMVFESSSSIVSTYDLEFYSIYDTSYPGQKYYDLNYYRYDYSQIRHFILDRELSAMLIKPKSNFNLSYNFVSVPSDSYFVSNEFYSYDVLTNSISSSQLNYNIVDYDNKYYAVGNFTFSSDSLLYEFYPYMNNGTIAYQYFDYVNTDVYVVFSDVNTLNVFNDNINNIDYDIQNLNSHLNSEIDNLIYYNFDNIQNFINSYISKKDDWLELFYTIYNPLPSDIKSLMILGWFFLHCLGIYLIFKD